MTEEHMNISESLQDISAFSDGNLDPAFMETPFSQFQALQVIQTETNPSWVKTRKSGKMDLSYVSGDTVTRLLNKAFRYKWSFYILETRVVESQAKVDRYNKDKAPEPQSPVIQVHGRLVVPGWGVREQWGAQPLSGGSDVQEHAFKSASTDAMKKCASMFGIALDLYGRDGMNDLGVTPHDFLTDDEVVIENLKKRLKEQRDQQNKPQPAAVAEEPKTETQPIVEPIAPSAPVVEQEAPQPMEEVVQQIVQPQPEVQEPKSSPQVQEAPANTSNQWQQEDIFGLREAKTKLGIADSNNEGLNVYTQEFFGMPEATYLNISPTNVKDFLHFLSSKY